MTTNQDLAAEVIASSGAICGSDCTRTPVDPITDCPRCVWCIGAYAQALAGAGLLASDLPEPYTVEGQRGACATTWNPGYTVLRTAYAGGAATEIESPVGNVWVEPGGGIGMDTDHSEMHLDPEDARALAHALLAATTHYATQEKK